MNAEDEARARLEVAQLYVEMGQLPKAARYYLAAAEIYRDAGLAHKARELLLKVMEFEPGNVQAQEMIGSLAGTPGVGGAPSAPARPAAAPAAQTPAAVTSGGGAGSGAVTSPTPCLFLRKDQQAAVMSQITQAPDPAAFPFQPLPRVDARAMAKRQEERRQAEEAMRVKDRTRVESAFGGGPGGLTAGGGGLLAQAKRSGQGRRKGDSTEDEAPKRGPRGVRSGNTDLADAIRRKLQGG
ncbi:MAG: hypothetical protein AB7S38_37490 [Vulcanimicrobiota bacterium]